MTTLDSIRGKLGKAFNKVPHKASLRYAVASLNTMVGAHSKEDVDILRAYPENAKYLAKIEASVGAPARAAVHHITNSLGNNM